VQERRRRADEKEAAREAELQRLRDEKKRAEDEEFDQWKVGSARRTGRAARRVTFSRRPLCRTQSRWRMLAKSRRTRMRTCWSSLWSIFRCVV
jgi:hypothetical protein